MGESPRQVAFLFDEAGDLDVRQIGGKASSLVAMTRMGLPVPPGFVVTTGVSRAFLEHGAFPVRLAGQLERCIKALEQKTGKRFGDSRRPLLVSARSGAPVSMPGMMDTVLNLGMTRECLPALARKGGEEFSVNTWSRFETGFRKIVGAGPPADPREQLAAAMAAVCRSWQSARAAEYRRANGIPEILGTAMIVQAMVFGNLNLASGTGVLFSRNVATGEPELYGEFLSQAQGDDVVGGGVTPLPIAKLVELHPQAFKQLAGWAGVLEHYYGDVVDIEFTIESGRLWMLQCRPAKRTPRASARFAVQAVWEKRFGKAEAVARVSDAEAERLGRPEFEKEALVKAAGNGALLVKGLAAAPGAAVGKAVFSPAKAKEMASRGEKVVLFRPDTSPDDLPGMMASVALVTATGGATSHAAVVARSLGIPAVVGCMGLSINGRASANGRAVSEGDLVAVDGASGVVMVGSLPFVRGSQSKEVSIFLKWLNELRPRPMPVPNWSAIRREASANTFLNDFYLADAMASAAAGTVLEREAVELRRQVIEECAGVFSCYLLIAVAGELRHSWQSSGVPETASARDELKTEFGVLPGDKYNRRQAQMEVVKKLEAAGREEWYRFLDLAVLVFSAKWSGQYGGKRWATIAQTVLDYLRGELNATVFVDRVFDLRHNGGVLFDKHPMLSANTNDGYIRYSLDRKKSAEGIERLYEALRQIWNRFSPPVLELWEKGKGSVWCRPQKGGKP